MTTTVTTTGADLFVRALGKLGVEVVFGLPGVHNLPIWEALAHADGVRLAGVRHEQTAVYAADGFARATGRLGVAVVTTGPGAANTLGATGEAMASGSAVLVIATDIPTGLRRDGVYRGVLHECRDQAGMFAPVTKRATTVASADQIAAAVADAGRLALAPNSGPVYLGIPTDLLSKPVSPDIPAAAPAFGWQEPVVPDLTDALALLEGAERPLIWAGGGALRAGAGEAVAELAERLAAPVLTTYMGRGLIAPEHPCFAPGPVHLPAVGDLWDEADVVIAIGTDFDGMMTQNWLMPAPPKLVTVNVDPFDAAKNYTPDVTLTGDARSVSAALAAAVTPRPESLARLRARLDTIAVAVREAVEEDEPRALDLLGAIRTALPSDTVIVADMCIPGYWLAGFHPVPLPRKLAYPVGWGTLGFAFPASLGSAAAATVPDPPTRRAVCVTGDGGFLFACGELATAAQEQLPVTVVLVDDGGYGMLRFDQAQAGAQSFGVDLHTPDFVALARSFGVPAVRTTGFDGEFTEHLRDSLTATGPVMIVVDETLKPPPTTSPRWYRRQSQNH